MNNKPRIEVDISNDVAITIPPHKVLVARNDKEFREFFINDTYAAWWSKEFGVYVVYFTETEGRKYEPAGIEDQSNYHLTDPVFIGIIQPHSREEFIQGVLNYNFNNCVALIGDVEYCTYSKEGPVPIRS